MSNRQITDLDVTPLSVGFDLRVQHLAVVLPPEARSVRYDEHGETTTATGTTEELTACLEAAGYEVAAQLEAILELVK